MNNSLRIHILTVTLIIPDDLPSTTISAVGTDFDEIQNKMDRVTKQWRKRSKCLVIADGPSRFVADIRGGAEVLIQIDSHNVPFEVTI